jgi:hypothetical protein
VSVAEVCSNGLGREEDRSRPDCGLERCEPHCFRGLWS